MNVSDPFNQMLGLSPAPGGSQAVPPATAPVPAGAGGTHAMGGGFEAADRYDQALSAWYSPIQHPDLEILPDKDLIDGRAYDMLRNDAFVQGGANLHKDNIVGGQYLLNCRPATKVLGLDDVWEEEFQSEVEEKFDLDVESPDNWIDAQRTNSFTSLVRLAVGVHLAGGEVLAAVEWLRDGRPFNTAIQMLDTARLSDPQDRIISIQDRENIRGGIRFNAEGAPQSYFIRTGHPSDIYYSTLGIPSWREVPIRKPWGRQQIIHIHEQVRPDQSRGISELATSLREQKFSRRFRDVNLQRAITQSLYAAAITSELPSPEVFARMGGSMLESPEGAQQAVTNYATGFLAAVAQFTGGAKAPRLDGVRIPHFFPGTKLEMLSPTSGHALGMEFEQSLLRYIAASIGVSYEQLSRDYTSTNYSSARAAMTETWKFMQARKKLVADRFASAIFRLWLEEQISKGEITTFPRAKMASLYSIDGRGRAYLNRNFNALARCDWVGASRGQIDEYKETQAAVLRIQNGLSTAEDELARLGKDFRKVYRQLAREARMRAALGLIITPGEISAADHARMMADDAAETPKKDAA